MKVLVIHGPNLDALGSRQPEIYGSETLADIDAAVTAEATRHEAALDIHQTAREGEIIELLHAAQVDGALVNPGAYAHTSRAIADAFASVAYPVVEVHLSNIHAREEWRHTSVTAASAAGVVTGFGGRSYVVGLQALMHLIQEGRDGP